MAKVLQVTAILILCLLLITALLRGSYVTTFPCELLRFPWAVSQQDLENGKEELQCPHLPAYTSPPSSMAIAEDYSPFSEMFPKSTNHLIPSSATSSRTIKWHASHPQAAYG